jgi:beta-glucanase (GH16 family)
MEESQIMYRRHQAAENTQYRKHISSRARCVLLTLILLAAMALPARAQWTQAWSDEFNGPAGSFPDPTNWTYDVGGGGWGNAELEVYCAAGSNAAPCSVSTSNVFMDGHGNLVIRAIRNSSGTWTSTRMKTEGLQQFQYGRIEARIKLTVGDGLWPAFWMLGTNIGSVGWPNCGESDIMEWVPQYTATTTSSTDHGPGYSGGSGIGARYIFPNNGRVDDSDYHTYGVVWSPYEMQFYRDDWTKPFLTVTPTFIPPGSQWVFNHPFFILLNEAIGGNFPKPGPDITTPNPADMLVDYVRVFTWDAGAPAAPHELGAKSKFSNQIDLRWEFDEDAGGLAVPDGYDIYASTTPDFQPSFNNLVVQHYHGVRYIHQGLNPSTTYYYQVRAVGPGGESASSNGASGTTRPFGHGAGIAINAGGYAVENFTTDVFSAGGFSNSHNGLVIDTSGVRDPAPQGVYQTEHWGASDWAIPNLNPRARYTLRLHFAENTFAAPRKRLFNVIVNGEQVLTDFDIFATAGAMSKAVAERFTVKPDENGIVSIQFVPGSADQPTICGIELGRADSDDWDGDDQERDDSDDRAPATFVKGSTGGSTTNIAINAGGPGVGSFLADTDFAGGRIGSSIPNVSLVDISAVTDPAPKEVYLTQRVGTGVGSFGYFIPGLIPGATYKVRLHFAEGFFKTPGSRMFNVVINGQTVLNNFDIVAAAGAVDKAVINEFSVKADRYGLIMLQFLVGSANLPSVRGIQLVETAPPASDEPE